MDLGFDRIGGKHGVEFGVGLAQQDSFFALIAIDFRAYGFCNR